MLYRFLFILSTLLLANSCRETGSSVPEPAFNPHVLQTGAYKATQGREVDMNLVSPPKYKRYSQKSQPLPAAEFISMAPDSFPVGQPLTMPVTLEKVENHAFDSPGYIKSQGKPIGNSWPRREEAQLNHTNDLGMSAAAGVYQSVVGFVLVIVVNWIVRRIDPDRALF